MLKYTPVSERSLSKHCVLSCYCFYCLPSLDLGSPPPWQTGAQAVVRSRSGGEVRAAAQPIGAPQSGAENWSSPIGATLNWSTTGVKSCKDIWVHFHMMASFNWRTGASLANRILNWVSRIIFSLTKDLPALCLNTSSQYSTISTWGSLRSPFLLDYSQLVFLASLRGKCICPGPHSSSQRCEWLPEEMPG